MSQEPPDSCQGENLCVGIHHDTGQQIPGGRAVTCQNLCCLSWVWPPTFHSHFPHHCRKVRAGYPGPTCKHSPVELHPYSPHLPRVTLCNPMHPNTHPPAPSTHGHGQGASIIPPDVRALTCPRLNKAISCIPGVWGRCGVPLLPHTTSSTTSASPGYGATYCTL